MPLLLPSTRAPVALLLPTDENACPFCAEVNEACDACTDAFFCAACWDDHPGRLELAEAEGQAGDDGAGGAVGADDGGPAVTFPVGSPEWCRQALLIRSLGWAYATLGPRLGPAVTTKLRRALREQQLASEAATQRVLATEQALRDELEAKQRVAEADDNVIRAAKVERRGGLWP